jgi:hypothetical protein
MYSFGVLILEFALDGRLAENIGRISWTDTDGSAMKGRCRTPSLFARRMNQGQRPRNAAALLQENERKAPKKVELLEKVMNQCLERDPKKRPTAARVQEMLMEVVEEDEASKSASLGLAFKRDNPSTKRGASPRVSDPDLE